MGSAAKKVTPRPSRPSPDSARALRQCLLPARRRSKASASSSPTRRRLPATASSGASLPFRHRPPRRRVSMDETLAFDRRSTFTGAKYGAGDHPVGRAAGGGGRLCGQMGGRAAAGWFIGELGRGFRQGACRAVACGRALRMSPAHAPRPACRPVGLGWIRMGVGGPRGLPTSRLGTCTVHAAR